MDIRRVYDYALQREHEGKRFFEENAAHMHHASVVGILEELAQQEQAHIDFIQGLIEQLEAGQAVSAADLAADLALDEGDFFAQRAVSEMIEQTTLESMTPDLPVLRMAYLIERDLAEFYEMVAAGASGQAQEALRLLARWERTHEALFKGLHDQLFQEYINMPWGG